MISINMMMYQKIVGCLKRLYQNNSAAVAMEAGLILPIMMMMLIGGFEVGRALVTAQKTITASQTAGDLIGRSTVVGQAEIDEAIMAARLAIRPLDDEQMRIAVISYEFDEDGNPQIMWQQNHNETQIADDLNDRIAPLGGPGEGVVNITVQYEFVPIFDIHFYGRRLFGSINMTEEAFVRGRRSPTVDFSGDDS